MRLTHATPFLLGAPSILFFYASAHAADEKGELWNATRKIFERSCFPCHGAGQRAARDFFVLKQEDLSGNLKAVEKRVLDSAGESRMPPTSYRKSFEDKYGVSREAFERLALKESDTAAIRKWIDAGAPIVEAKAAAAEFIRDEEVIEAILADAMDSVPAPDRKYARYLSLANLLRAGDSPGDMALYRNGIRKLLASLTWRSKAPEVKVVEKSKGTVLRFDLRHLEYSPTLERSQLVPWDASLWEEIARVNPYGIPFFGDKALRLQRELGTKHVFLRADWFAFHATQPAIYSKILGLPGPLMDHAIERLEYGLIGVYVQRNISNGKVARAGTTNSGVSANHRIIERHALPNGNYYWASYDFRAPQGRSNILDFPVGPLLAGFPTIGPHDFTHAGGEFIFSLPNGLQGYFLTTSGGAPLETAPTDIVQNPKSRDAVVQNGISCIECHAQGMRPNREDMDKFQDQLRPYVEATADDAELLAQVQRLHPGTETIRRLIEEDRKHFEEALGRLGLEEAVDSNGRRIDAEPIFHLVDRFQGKVESRNAAAELNMTPEELLQQFKSPFLRNNRTMRQLAARLEFTQVSRDEFLAVFEKMLELMLGVSAPAGGSDSPQPGKSFTLLLREPDLKMDMVWIEPGRFIRGSPAGEVGRNDDEAPHDVRIGKGFWLGKTEVTQRQYQAIVGDNFSKFKDSGPEAPVENVGGRDALGFCKSLRSRVRRLPEGYQFSLPTEAQWEYACRAGTTGPIYGPSLDAIAWHQGNSGGRTHPVGTKQSNAWGLHDMLGNVWEWCFDAHAAYPPGLSFDPEGPIAGPGRVYRGGSWQYDARTLRAAEREKDNSGSLLQSIGFRVCLRPVRD